jgi:hypothetical protein
MPLDVRSIAIKFAVVCFFGIAVVGFFSGLSPFACSERAVIGALIAYITGTFAARIINAVLISAIAAHQAGKRREKSDVDEV